MTLYVPLAVIVTLSLSVTVSSSSESHIITSNAVTHGKSSPAAVHATRYRRQAQPLTSQQMREIVNVHNDLRAEEGKNHWRRQDWVRGGARY